MLFILAICQLCSVSAQRELCDCRLHCGTGAVEASVRHTPHVNLGSMKKNGAKIGKYNIW